eukprot:TRINITY_DN8403_c0_g1_i1.p1 TRINITY_DN8403_c0_g1~~TRINITY_DN8403_c0_g1_i1.p1  ORF type:complete len:292 (-),score=55.75 TRINITY_DN8403_c0_g1_i1:6-881(-)
MEKDKKEEFIKKLGVEDDVLVDTTTGGELADIPEEHIPLVNEFILKHVESIMEKKLGLTKIELPKANMSYIYASSDALSNPSKLLVIIQGIGDNVRPGIWSYRICLKASLKSGSMLSLIEQGMKEGYGILILNPNQNSTLQKQEDGSEVMVPIPGNETRENHAIYVFDHYINVAKAERVYIIGHSAGGKTAVDLLTAREKQFLPRLNSMALADSRMVLRREMSDTLLKMWRLKCRIWATSTLPLDSPVKENLSAPAVSGGTEDHDLVPSKAQASMFKFLQSQSEQKNCSIM